MKTKDNNVQNWNLILKVYTNTNSHWLFGFRSAIGSSVFAQKRMSQKLRSRPSFTKFLLQTTLNETAKFRRCPVRQTGRIPETYSTHEGGPIGSLTWLKKRKMTQIKLQQSKPQAPNISSITIVIPSVGIGVKSFRTHISTSTHIRITSIQRTAHDFTNTKIGYFHLHAVVINQ